MKCPHCGAKVGVFSKAMNRAGRTKECPHCSQAVKLRLNVARFAGVFFAVAIGASFLGMGGSIAMGAAGALAALAGMDLKVA